MTRQIGAYEMTLRTSKHYHLHVQYPGAAERQETLWLLEKIHTAFEQARRNGGQNINTKECGLNCLTEAQHAQAA